MAAFASENNMQQNTSLIYNIQYVKLSYYFTSIRLEEMSEIIILSLTPSTK
jgi:hypothetical protein